MGSSPPSSAHSDEASGAIDAPPVAAPVATGSDPLALHASSGLNDLATVHAQLQLYAADLRKAIALERARRQELERAYLDTVAVLAAAVEARDPYTGGHAERVAAYAVGLATALGWSRAEIEETRLGGLLHDIGKLAVDDQVLRKPGPLDEVEWEQMRRHPQVGAQVLGRAPFLARVVIYVLHHHERWDGRGYPAGLAGFEIPAAGRVMGIADAFDAMTSHRPYRPALDPEQAAEEIARCAGSQFDPDMAHAFLQAVRDGHIPILSGSRPSPSPLSPLPHGGRGLGLPAEAPRGEGPFPPFAPASGQPASQP